MPVHGAKYLSILLGLLLALPAISAQSRVAVKAPADVPFSFDLVIAEAKRRAAAPFSPQRGSMPAWLQKLSPEQYLHMKFNPEADIWRRDASPFRMDLLPVGFNFKTTVRISIVEEGKVRDVAANTSMFEFGAATPTPPTNAVLPLSGFRIRGHLDSRKSWDDFLVFQGASYFEAIAQNQVFGLKARGLAVGTAEPSGEEFPAFTHFWVVRPNKDAAGIDIYALLESQSTSGAFRFTVTPGRETSTDVDMTLFPRASVNVYGIAPLTSMFLFDETNRGRLDDYRPEVHDSDGLQITTHTGERVWRPLANPAKLQISTFTNDMPQGFGLVQRSRNPQDFEDLDAHYERRPSVWIEPRSDWGPGAVELVEIPSGRATNDNIVALFRPASDLRPAHAVHFAYRITWLGQPKPPKGFGETLATRSGASLDGKRRIFQIDFVGAGDKVEGLRLDLSASAGKLSNLTLVPNPSIKGMRASFEIDPRDADLIELRLRVMRGEQPVTETWIYRWTAS